MFEITTVNAREITNKRLIQVTNSIIKSAENVAQQCYKIANNLFKVKSEKLYEQDGFKDVVDYANTMFGFKKSTTYTLLRTREKFIEEGTDHTIFYDEENKRDFKYNQLEPLLKLDKEEAIQVIEENEIDMNTPVREIKRIVKDLTEKSAEKIIEEPVEEIIEEPVEEIIVTKDQLQNLLDILYDDDFTNAKSIILSWIEQCK